MEHHAAMSSGSVVFALPHLRDAIFFYHAEEVLRQRKAKLDAIDRPVHPAFWSANAAGYRDTPPDKAFAAKQAAFSTHSNLLATMQTLGLELASYLDLLATRRDDAHLWLAGCVALNGSRKWKDAKGRGERLEALPRSRTSSRLLPERPQSNAAEMLYHGAGGSRWTISSFQGGTWEESEGLGHVLHDQVGRLYLARLVHTGRQPFIFEAAAKQPSLLYSSASPFFPVHDQVQYNATSQIGVVITQVPPYPLSHHLAPGQPGTRDELRRVLERMQDLFQHLVTLEEYGVSLMGKAPSDSWMRSFLTSHTVPWLVPAYLAKPPAPGRRPGRLIRADYYEEQLPPAPVDAWPVAPFEGEGGLAGLPWSQATAYSDPRVRGPKVFLHGVLRASWDDKDLSWKDRDRRYPAFISNEVQPQGRYHADLLNFTECILQRFFPISDLECHRVTQLLRSGVLADAYERCIVEGADSGPRNAATGRSGLFTFCANCYFQYRQGRDWGEGKIDLCPTCKRHCFVNTMPKAIQDLLLRIIQPEVQQDGTPIVVTAKEALATVNSVMVIELPRLLKVYQAWVEKQQKVVRVLTAPQAPLSKMRNDVSGERWLLLELLRGNFLDVNFSKTERKEARDLVKAFLDRKKAEAQGKASRTGASSTSTAGPESVATALPIAAIGSSKRLANIGQDEEAAPKKAKKA